MDRENLEKLSPDEKVEALMQLVAEMNNVKNEVKAGMAADNELRKAVCSLKIPVPENMGISSLVRAYIGEAEKLKLIGEQLKNTEGFDDVGLVEMDTEESLKYIPQKWHDKTVAVGVVRPDNPQRIKLIRELAIIAEDISIQRFMEEDVPESMRETPFILINIFHKGFSVAALIGETEFREHLMDLFISDK